MNVRSLLLFGACGLVAASAASADDAPGAPSAATLEVITVTAQRRSENLQDVPIAVTAVTAAQLQAQGVGSTLDLGQAVSGLTITNSVGYELPRIRGIGDSVIGAGFEGGVATYIDGVYMAAAPAALLSLNNIEQIEVLKGPQGTLFGRNATGGLIQIITREPQDAFSGNVDIGYGNYQTFTADTYVTGGLGNGVAADFAGHVATQGQGFGVNEFNGMQVNRVNEDVALRSSVLYRPADDTKIRIIADYEQNSGSVYGAVHLAPGTSAPFPQRPLSPWDVDSDQQPVNHLRSGGISGRLDQSLGFAVLTSITAYRRDDNLVGFDADGTSTPAQNAVVNQQDNQFSQELQLASHNTSTVKWVGGLYYFLANSRYDPSQVTLFGSLQPLTPVGPIGGVDIYSHLKTDALAAYGQATAPIADDTNLTLGLRYNTEEHSISSNETFDFVGGPSGVPAAPIDPQSKRFSQPTWRVSLDHRFSPELMTYASYNRGFKSGGFNGQLPTDPAFAPEKLDAYEVGMKSDLFDRRLRVNTAAFYYDYTDIQVSKYTDGQISYYNGAAATAYGLDTDLEAQLSARFKLTGGFTVMHDRFTNFPNAILSNQVPGGLDIGIGSATGNELPQTPDFSATIAGEYSIPVRSGILSADVGYSYDSGYYAQVDNILRQPSYNMVNAALRLEFNDGLRVRLWAKNLTNAEVAQFLAAGSFDSLVTYGPPRTYGISVGYVF